MESTLYLGPPGTGKTTKLVSIVHEAVLSGTDISRIGYMSFTKAAVNEAINRVKVSQEDALHFRTMHSECFRLLGLSTSMVMQAEHYHELGQRLGINLAGKSIGQQSSLDDLSDGDKALGLVELARLRDEPIKQVWERLDQEVGVDWALVDLIDRALQRYKELNFLLDFTGMLEEYLTRGAVPELDLLVIDEAQDLSHLQWKVLEKLSSNSTNLILAGDDDQAIYHWAGVCPNDLMVTKDKASKVCVLDKSWRLPRSVYDTAQSIVSRITNRIPKVFSPRDEVGQVDMLASLDEAGLEEGRWLVLVRNRFLAAQVAELCLREGILYEGLNDSPARWPSVKAAVSWEALRKGKSISGEESREVMRMGGFTVDIQSTKLVTARKEVLLADLKKCGVTDTRPWFEALTKIPSDEAEYIRAMLRRGEKLKEKPRVKINTIHGAKGCEEDNVLLLVDQSYRTWNGAERDPDGETRVFYVGATRAKKRLAILQPQTRYFFNL